MATDKKIALVTGANRGIGFETARQLGKKGVTVIVAARTLKSAEETASKLKTDGVEAVPLKLDVTTAQDREAAAKTTGDKFGKLDILVNNAGKSTLLNSSHYSISYAVLGVQTCAL